MSQLEKHKQYKIIINGQEVITDNHTLSYSQVVELAFPSQNGINTIFTVTYRKSDEDKHSGTLVEGRTVKIKNGTIFDVTQTTKS